MWVSVIGIYNGSIRITLCKKTKNPKPKPKLKPKLRPKLKATRRTQFCR